MRACLVLAAGLLSAAPAEPPAARFRRPVAMALNENGGRLYVANHRSGTVSVIDTARQVVEAEHAVGRQLPLQGGERLIIADAFGGQLAVVNVQRAAVESVRSLPAHNIRGLALSRDGRMLLAHQHLSALAHTTRDDVHWGNVVTNQLRSLRLSAVLAPAADALADEDVQPLGDVDRGAGDPA